MSKNRKLSLYHRRGCHLCDEMLEAVELRIVGLDITVETVDIDNDAALTAQFGQDIPVLEADGLEICRHRLDPERFNTWLSAV